MAHRVFCPGTALTCSISNASFRRSTRASRCLTGASTSPRQTSLHSTSSASPIAIGTVQFSATNPLQFWRTDGVQGINRRPFFNTATAPPGLRTEAQTLALGNQYPAFRSMEGNPHGSAHTSFGGSISSIPTAARDPLFFLLHCNVDRLWAKWQRQNGRFDPAQAASYDSNPGNPIGHNLPDTMWPWNGITGGSTSSDGPRRRDGRVTVCQRAGATTASAGQPGLPRLRQRRLPHGIRLRRCAICLMCLARGDRNHDQET